MFLSRMNEFIHVIVCRVEARNVFVKLQDIQLCHEILLPLVFIIRLIQNKKGGVTSFYLVCQNSSHVTPAKDIFKMHSLNYY